MRDQPYEVSPCGGDLNVKKGARVSDRYLLEVVIAVGKMGIVWRVHDLLRDEKAAVKFSRSPYAADPWFKREVEICRRVANIGHSALLCAYDIGEWKSRSFIVMPLLHGETVHEYLEARGGRKLSLKSAVQIALNVLAGLRALHRSRIAHRDVGGKNIFLDNSAGVLLFDYSVSTWFGAHPAWERKTYPGIKAGGVTLEKQFAPFAPSTPGEANAVIDLYKLAEHFFLWITRRRATHLWPADDAKDLCDRFRAHLSPKEIALAGTGAPTDEASRGKVYGFAGMPVALDAWIHRGLAQNRKVCFDTAAEMRNALHAVYQQLYTARQ